MSDGIGWFEFSFSDFSFAFLSILLEGAPFLLLGTIMSGLIDQFLPAKVMTRLLPRNAYAGAAVSGLLGFIFPMCECGVVPVIRRLMAKGLPVSNAVVYMLSAPIVNVVVVLSTYAAFRNQMPEWMTGLRLGVGYGVAVLTGMVVHNLSIKYVLRKNILAEITQARGIEGGRRGGFGTRMAGALQVAVSDFLDMMVYFIIGCAAAATFSTAVNQEFVVPLAVSPALATFSMMGLAGILSLCSTTDAFIAATFVTFPAVSKLAFLVFGPMMDVKLIFIYSSVFRKRFVLGMVVGLFILVGLICVRLSVVFLPGIE
ncbi:MAG: permease [Chthoniobacterales bacterium]